VSIQTYPTTYELYAKYKEFREIYFNNIVPPAHEVTIEWSSSLTSVAGKCYYRYRRDPKGFFLSKKGERAVAYNQIIRLSTQYHEIFPEDTYNTLLHEMIHLLIGGHGPNFAYWIDRITAQGGKVTRFCQTWQHLKEPKWLYTCQLCGKTWERTRRLAKTRGERRRVWGCPNPCGGTVTEEKIVANKLKSVVDG
jgi:hypothetical protein